MGLKPILKYAGDIDAISKTFLATGKHSYKSELQSYVLAKLKLGYGVMCFPTNYERLTLDDYKHKYGEDHFKQKVGAIDVAIHAFQTPENMVIILQCHRTYKMLRIYFNSQ